MTHNRLWCSTGLMPFMHDHLEAQMEVGCATSADQYRAEFLEHGPTGFFDNVCRRHTLVFCGYLDPEKTYGYYAFYLMNQFDCVYLKIMVFRMGQVAKAEIIHIMWLIKDDLVYASVPQDIMPRALQILHPIFYHRRLKLISREGEGAAYEKRLFYMTKFKDYNQDITVYLSGDSSDTVKLDIFPKYVNPCEIWHFAGMLKAGMWWINPDFEIFHKEFMFCADEDAHAPLVLNIEGGTETYKSCHVWLEAVAYDKNEKTVDFEAYCTFYKGNRPIKPQGDFYGKDITTIKLPESVEILDSKLDDDTSEEAAAKRLSVSISWSWNLEHNVIFFRKGGYVQSISVKCPRGKKIKTSWLHNVEAFKSLLMHVFVVPPGVIWDASLAISFSRWIHRKLNWLPRLVLATRDRLPVEVAHMVGMSQVPKSIREAYQLPRVLPKPG